MNKQLKKSIFSYSTHFNKNRWFQSHSTYKNGIFKILFLFLQCPISNFLIFISNYV